MEVADSLESAAFTDLDRSFFEEDNMLALIPPSRLIKLGLALRSMILPSLAERVDQIAEDADLDEKPDSHFKKLLGVLERIEAIADDLDTASMIDDTRDQVKRSVKAMRSANASTTRFPKTKLIGPHSDAEKGRPHVYTSYNC